MNNKNLAASVFLGGTLVAAIVWWLGRTFMNPPQCPANFTQEQINASNCIVGANIGIGFAYALAIGIWIAATVAAAWLLVAKKTRL